MDLWGKSFQTLVFVDTAPLALSTVMNRYQNMVHLKVGTKLPKGFLGVMLGQSMTIMIQYPRIRIRSGTTRSKCKYKPWFGRIGKFEEK